MISRQVRQVRWDEWVSLSLDCFAQDIRPWHIMSNHPSLPLIILLQPFPLFISILFVSSHSCFPNYVPFISSDCFFFVCCENHTKSCSHVKHQWLHHYMLHIILLHGSGSGTSLYVPKPVSILLQSAKKVSSRICSVTVWNGQASFRCTSRWWYHANPRRKCAGIEAKGHGCMGSCVSSSSSRGWPVQGEMRSQKLQSHGPSIPD